MLSFNEEPVKIEEDKRKAKKSRSNVFVRLVLAAVVIGLSALVISMLAEIAVDNKACEEKDAAIREQNMKNAELAEILDPTNAADFNRDIAEKELDYADGGEKVYVSPDSGK